MKKNNINVLKGIILICIITLCSCSTPKSISYFQDAKEGEAMAIAQEKMLVVRPEDKLNIVVNSKDPVLGAMVNLPTMSYGNTSNASTTGSATSFTQSGSSSTYSYTVAQDGTIDFPAIGLLKVVGLTRNQIASSLADLLKSQNLIKDPVVTVEFANLYCSVLGEVKTPGRYSFDHEHMTVLDALALAGDVTINGVRENVLVLRYEDGMEKGYRLDLTSQSSMAKSPAFYLQQKDVIYVEPNAKRQRETTVNGNNVLSTGFWVSVTSLLLSIATLVVNLTN